jgi:hypothetical protein
MTDDAAPTQPESAAPVPEAERLEQTGLAPAPAAAMPVADLEVTQPAQPAQPAAAIPPVVTPAAPTAVPRPGGGYRGRIRSITIGLAFFLTCLSLVLATTTWWLHDTLLSTDRFVALTAPLASNAEVQDALVQVTVTQVDEALDLGPIGSYVVTGIAREIYASDAFAQLWERGMAYVHTQLVSVLRGDNSVVQTSDGKVVVNLFPLLNAVLTKVDELDIVIAGNALDVPTLTDPSDPAASRAELEALLGRDLKPTFGLVAVADSTKLEAAQQYVKLFDALVIVLFAVTGLLALLTLALARRRLRMVALLGIGALAALLVARLVISSAADGLATAVVEAGPGAIIGGQVVREIADSYREFARVVLLIGIAAAVGATAAAWLLERRASAAFGARGLAGVADGWFLALAGLVVALVALLVVGLTAVTLVVVAAAYVVWLVVVIRARRHDAVAEGAAAVGAA